MGGAADLRKRKVNLPSREDDVSASVRMIYCPYTDRDIPVIESSPEHIIPLALGGLNSFTLPVSAVFNSKVGTDIDGALANDFLVISQRDKHGVKGHRGKHPEYVSRSASNAVTGEPLQVTLGQRRGLRIWSPRQKHDVTGQGQKINLSFQMDLDVELRFVAKVALSAGYFFYGEAFRNHVKHQDFRTIMNHRPNEMGEAAKTIEARYDYRFREPETDNDRIRRAMVTCFGARSVVALIPNSSSFSVEIGILGSYLGMLSVPADTRSLPNSEDYRWGHFIALDRPTPIADSIWKLLHRMAKMD
jgi:hypothetical protein